MIKRKDDQWTTIQCRNCMDCYKVLNGKFQIKQQCPYCSRVIDLDDKHPAPSEPIKEAMAKQFPKVREEDTIGYELAREGSCAHCFGQGKGDCPEC